MRYYEWSILCNSWEDDLRKEVRNIASAGKRCERMLREAEKHIREISSYKLMRIRNEVLSMFESFVRVFSGMAKLEAAKEKQDENHSKPMSVLDMEKAILKLENSPENAEKPERKSGRELFIDDVKAIRIRLDMETLFMKKQSPTEPSVFIVNELRNITNYIYQFMYSAKTFGGDFEAVNRVIERYAGTMVIPKGVPVGGFGVKRPA